MLQDPGTTLYSFSESCSQCPKQVVYEVKAPDGARVDSKSFGVREIVCPDHQSPEKLEAMAAEPSNVFAGGGPCVACSERIGLFIELPPGHTATVDFGRQVHGDCAEGRRRAG